MALPSILPEVKIKLCKQGAGDSVIIIENLPKEFIYRRKPLRAPKLNRDGEFTGELVNMKDTEDAVHEKLSVDQSGRGFIHFEIRNAEVMDMYKRIMDYVETSIPRGEIIPRPVPYAAMPGHPMSPPINDDQIPRVTIPISSPPSAQAVEVGTPAKTVTTDDLRKMQERAAKARAAKQAKKDKTN